jgi:NADH:ubiquinone oxidoreductase subunit 6 (subunit J)
MMTLLMTKTLQFLFVDQLSITAVMVLGAAAIYLLLPRPHGRNALAGGLLGLLALVLAGVVLVGVRTANANTIAETILFYAFSAIALIAGVLLVTQRNPARAALAFALVVLSTSGLFLLLAAPFLMAATVIIYAGAIIVTFLFVLMLAQQEGRSDADYRSREPLLSTIAGFVLLGALLYVLHLCYSTAGLDNLIAETHSLELELDRLQSAPLTEIPADQQAVHDLLDKSVELLKRFRIEAEKQPLLPESRFLIDAVGFGEDYQINNNVRQMASLLAQVEDNGQALRRTVGMLQPAEQTSLSELSGPASSRPPSELRHDETGRPPLPAENTAYLGRSLFTDYLLAVELGGTLLLVATVGAIAIAYRRPR